MHLLGVFVRYELVPKQCRLSLRERTPFRGAKGDNRRPRIMMASAWRAFLFQDNAISLHVVLDTRHERLDEHDSTTAGTLQVFFGGGVGDITHIEAGTLVLDLDSE